MENTLDAQRATIQWDRLLFATILLLSVLGFFGAYAYLAVITQGDHWVRVEDAFQVVLPILTLFLGIAVVLYLDRPGK